MSNAPDITAVFANSIIDHLEAVRSLQDQSAMLERIAHVMLNTLHRGGKILWCGNGGSAADSQHLAAEIVCRYRRNRKALPSIALTTDTSVLTAIANDFGYEAVFSRQVEALGTPRDVLVAISTSGNSSNVVAALNTAKLLGMTTVAFAGCGGGALAQAADFALVIGSNETARIQEAHILAGHMLCDWVELDALHTASLPPSSAMMG